MVDIYSTIQQNRLALDRLAFAPRQRAAWPFTLGGTIMQRSRGQASAQGGNYVYDDQVVGYLHAVLQANGWQWSPTQEGDDGGAVLDFDRNLGECSFVAAALEVLLYAPAPYGFELAQASVGLASYGGANAAGFIALHDPAVAFGLGYNIIDRTTGRLREGYYLWGNHTVTEWAGDFYDANYNRLYGRLSDMAAIEMQSVQQRVHCDALQTIVETVDLSATRYAALDGLYVRTDGYGEYPQKLLELSRRQNRALGAEARSFPLVGPFARPYDETLPYTIDLG